MHETIQLSFDCIRRWTRNQIMSSEKVWHRFEKKKDGTVWKLRIQDLPPDRLRDCIDLLANFFARDEAIHRAAGITKNPYAMERYRKFYEKQMRNPLYRVVICCSDDTPEVTKLMGVSMMSLSTDVTSLGTKSTAELWNPGVLAVIGLSVPGRYVWRRRRPRLLAEPRARTQLLRQAPLTRALRTLNSVAIQLDLFCCSLSEFTKTEETQELPEETKKILAIAYEYLAAYNPVTELNLVTYYNGKGIVVDPVYRGLGIAENFLKVRRLMCEAHGVPMTGAWMTAFGTQKAGERDGWETVKEIEYDYFAKKYDVTFTDVPHTMKFMIAKVGNTGSTKKLIDH